MQKKLNSKLKIDYDMRRIQSKIIILSATLMTISCSSNNIETHGELDRVEISNYYPESIKNDDRLIGYLELFHDDLFEAFRQDFIKRSGEGLFNQITSAISNNSISIKAERKRISEQYNDETMQMIFEEENHISQILCYAYHNNIWQYRKGIKNQVIMNEYTTKNDSTEFIHRRFLHVEGIYGDDDYNDWINNVRKTSKKLELSQADLRYKLAINRVYGNEVNLTQFEEDAISALQELNTTRIAKYLKDERLSSLTEHLSELIVLFAEDNIEFKKRTPTWSAKKASEYKYFCQSVIGWSKYDISLLNNRIEEVNYHNLIEDDHYCDK